MKTIRNYLSALRDRAEEKTYQWLDGLNSLGVPGDLSEVGPRINDEKLFSNFQSSPPSNAVLGYEGAYGGGVVDRVSDSGLEKKIETLHVNRGAGL